MFYSLRVILVFFIYLFQYLTQYFTDTWKELTNKYILSKPFNVITFRFDIVFFFIIYYLREILIMFNSCKDLNGVVQYQVPNSKVYVNEGQTVDIIFI